MLKAYKTEIKPSDEQQHIINCTIGTCRYVYNFYLGHNQEVYETEKRFVSGKDFSKWLNNEYLPQHPEKAWIKDVSSKSIKQSIMNGDKAFRRFFKGLSGFPNFKKKNSNEAKMYFVKTDATVVIPCERHRIKIPTLGWVRIKEKGYLPTKYIIRSGSVSKHAGRYYVSVLVDIPEITKLEEHGAEGTGIDLGIKSLATCSTEKVYKNINYTDEVRRLEKKLRREQRKLSRKYESLKLRKKESEDATRQNIQKQVLVVQRLHQRLTNIRTDYINKTVNELVKTKPAYMTIEDLNVKGMMKNKHLAKSIAQQKFSEFRTKLEGGCKRDEIELRIADRWFPSSKLCHACGNIKKDLKLSDRVYRCECGYEADRDHNASLNLRDTKAYTVA